MLSSIHFGNSPLVFDSTHLLGISLSLSRIPRGIVERWYETSTFRVRYYSYFEWVTDIVTWLSIAIFFFIPRNTSCVCIASFISIKILAPAMCHAVPILHLFDHELRYLHLSFLLSYIDKMYQTSCFTIVSAIVWKDKKISSCKIYACIFFKNEARPAILFIRFWEWIANFFSKKSLLILGALLCAVSGSSTI